MNHKKIQILAIVPYDGMQISLNQAALEYPNVELKCEIGNLDDALRILEQTKDENYDVIISRGGTADILTEHTVLPVISVQLSVYDILRSIRLAENYSQSYAIVGFSNVTEPAHIVCNLLEKKVSIRTIKNPEDVFSTLEKLKEEGCKIVIGDVITHQTAWQMGMDAFLITSGMESIHQAFKDAINIGTRTQEYYMENFFLYNIAMAKAESAAILDSEGQLCYHTATAPSKEQLEFFRKCIKEIPFNSSKNFYQNDNGRYVQVLARIIIKGGQRYYQFRYRASRIPLKSDKNGMNHHSPEEIAQLFAKSFYSISGAMGNLENRVKNLAVVHHPVIIVGESGTGKEQIARALYLYSPFNNSSFCTVECSLMNDKSWDYLFNHISSPLNETRGTIFFNHIEKMPESALNEILWIFEETNIVNRLLFIFSANANEQGHIPETARVLINKCSYPELELPTLRERSDEIPSLAALYLASLNETMGKQVIGFEPNAISQLMAYNWPNNFTQFKKVLTELAFNSESTYISSHAVAEVLANEQKLHHAKPHIFTDTSYDNRTLDQITKDAILNTLERFNGNQSAAANHLGISRTTMWRFLKEKN